MIEKLVALFFVLDHKRQPITDTMGYVYREAAERLPDHTEEIMKDSISKRTGNIFKAVGSGVGQFLTMLVGSRVFYLMIAVACVVAIGYVGNVPYNDYGQVPSSRLGWIYGLGITALCAGLCTINPNLALRKKT